MKPDNSNIFKRLMYQRSMSLVLILLLVGTILSYSFLIDVNNADMMETENVDKISELEWDFISSELEGVIELASVQSKLVTGSIVEDILAEYANTPELFYEHLSDPSEEHPIYDIIRKNINKKFILDGSSDNGMFVATTERILINPQNRIFTNNKTWLDVVKNDSNQKSLYQLLKSKESYIIWDNSADVAFIADIDAIRQYYDSDGICFLNKLTILVPTYITNTGDIFGMADYDAEGANKDNQKLIVIQQFNAREALFDSEKLIEDFSSIKSDYDRQMSYHIIIESLTYMMIAMTFVIVILLLIKKNNKYVQVDNG